MRTKIFLIFVLLTIYSCNNRKEAEFIKGFVLGEPYNSWNSKIDKLIEEGELSDVDSFKFHDRVYKKYRSYIAGIPVEFMLNPDYYRGKLRIIQYNLGGDTVYLQQFFNVKYRKLHSTPDGNFYLSDTDPFFNRSGGYRKYEDGIKIYNQLVHVFGKPDREKRIIDTCAIIYKNGDTLSYNPVNYNSTDYAYLRLITEDVIYCNPDPSIYAFWEKEDYNIELNLTCKQSYYNYHIKPCSSAISSNSELVFKIKNYEDHYNKLRDSLKNQYSINDIIGVEIDEIEWEKETQNIYKMNIYLNFTRPLSLDDRLVSSIRFDIIILDNFDEEICRVQAITKQFKDNEYDGIQAGGSLRIITLIGGTKPHSIEYNRYYDPNGYDKARKYAEKFSVKAVADVNAIKFNDGTVMKKN